VRREGPLPLAEALRIATETAEALEAAHQAGVVHRDIKPHNILVGTEGEARVTDFGIARAMEGTRLSRSGATIGTAEYMSPEQAEGLEKIDHRTDIYSLGVVVYEMLCGRVPFTGTNPVAVAMQHVNAAPPPLRGLVSVPEGVERAVMRALAKDPRQRYDSCAEFVRALVEGETAQVPLGMPPQTGGTAPSPAAARRPASAYVEPRRNYAAFALVPAILALSVVGGDLLLHHGRSRTTEPLRQADGPVRLVQYTFQRRMATTEEERQARVKSITEALKQSGVEIDVSTGVQMIDGAEVSVPVVPLSEAEFEQYARAVREVLSAYEASVPPPPGGGDWFVICASKTAEREAQEAVNRLRQAGIPATLDNSSNYPNMSPGYYIACAARFVTKDDADRITAQVKSKGFDAYPRKAHKDQASSGLVPQSAASVVSWERYENPGRGFRIERPADWSVRTPKTPPGRYRIEFWSPEEGATFVVEQTIPTTGSPRASCERLEAELRASAGKSYARIDMSETTVGGVAATRWEYYSTFGGHRWRSVNTQFVFGQTGCAILYRAWEDRFAQWDPTFARMLNSFALTGGE